MPKSEKLCDNPNCKKKFLAYRDSMHFCSPECANSKRVKMRVWLICNQCGNPYLVAARLQDIRKNCSKSCLVSSEDFKSIQGDKFKNYNQTPEASLKSQRNMRSLHQDPKFKAAHAKRSSERLKIKWQDEEFRDSHSELSSKIMANNWKNPEFVTTTRNAASKSMTNRMKDPEFRSMMEEVHRQTMIENHRDPAFVNKLDSARSLALSKISKNRQGYPKRQRILYEELFRIFRFDCAYEYHVFVDMLEDTNVAFYKLDLAIISKMVNIEVDGWSHNGSKAKEYDKVRNNTLCQLGWKVIRVQNDDIDKDLDGVVQRIIEMIKDFSQTPKTEQNTKVMM